VTGGKPKVNSNSGENPAGGGIVGRGGHGKIDGLSKITGQAKFTDDIKLPRMAHAKVLRSPHAHAKILSIDASKALQMPGVLDVLTGTDIPIRYGPIPVARDETALAIDKVRYVGEPVVAVAATTEAIAWEAARQIQIEYEVLPGIFSIQDALDTTKPLIHDQARKPSNVLRRVKRQFGDVDAAFQSADLVLEERYNYPGSTHVPLEPHSALAEPSPDGTLTLWSSTQNPHQLHQDLARVLGMSPSKIRIIKPAVGAGYGGKCDMFVTEVCASVFARRLARPIRFSLEREEVFYAHRGRHPTEMILKMSMTQQGKITAVDLQAWADGGAYSSYGVATAYYLGALLTLPYQLDNYRFTAQRLYTNKPPCGPKRGHGVVQSRFAFEVHLDRMAQKLGLSSVAVRRANLIKEGSTTINNLVVPSFGLPECIDRVLAASSYDDKKGRMPAGRGIGMAVSAYICGASHPIHANDMPHSGVQVKLDRSGIVTIFSGTADIGQGSSHMLATIISERLGIRPDLCRIVEGDTDLTPVDLGSYSSRVTFMAGNAALQAADSLRDLILSAVASSLDVPIASLSAKDGWISAGEQRVSWRQAVVIAESVHGTLSATGSYRPKKTGSRFLRSTIGGSPAYSFTAQVAEVTIDPDTGIMKIDKIWCAHDLGRVLHPEIAEGQVEGGVYMGVGEALTEEQAYRNGVLVAPSILEYRIPTIHETPDITSILIESHDPGGPFGAKEVGEGPQLPTVPAIANAIEDAVGVWMTQPPFTPEKIHRAIVAANRKMA